MVDAATAPAAFGYGSPTFVDSAAPISDGSSFFSSDGAGEPSIGINWLTGKGMYQASTDTYQLSFNNAVNPPAVSWTDVTSPYLAFSLDPILATDRTTGVTLAGADNGACGSLSRTTTDGGTTSFDPTAWTPTYPCTGTIDHPTVGFGPAVGPLAATAAATGGRVAYYCQQEALLDECSHSLDAGVTWSPSVPDPSLTCDYLFGHIKADEVDGTAYIPNSNCLDANGDPVVGGLMTTDSGATLSSYIIPGATTPARGFDPSVAITPDHTVYQAWEENGDYHPVVTWSKDHGQTWVKPVDLAKTVSPALTGASFASAVAGDNGRAAVAFLGTWAGTAGKTPYDSGFHGVWYVFVSYTYDGGLTWQTVQATPNPIQRGYIDDGGLNPTNPTGGTTQRNLLDFIDASMTKDGRVVVAYADGCLQTDNTLCTTEAQSTHGRASVAYQSTGRGLLSAYDVTPVTAPSAPTLSATSGSSGVDLGWTVPADGGAAISGYQVLRGTSAGGETLLATVPAPATSYTDSTAVAGTTYYYRVAAVNSVGVGDPSNEVSIATATAPAAPAATASDGNGKVTVAWSSPADGGSPITGYQVYRGLAPGAETPYTTVGAVTSYADTAVNAGTTYYYRVAATNAVGTGTPSAETAATPTTVPSAATLTATAGKAQVSLSWSTPASGGAPITGWTIYRATASGAEQPIQTISSGTSYVDNTVAGGTTYYYEVAAINRNGTGALSREAAVTPKRGR